eukprot:GFUD01045420.1.p1 GENE.GFUD01045420.1~~GFUD01045420.1.p1  ORF type:complete len:843 (+),score=287.48 GFUD01045420.1:73-2601(+)
MSSASLTAGLVGKFGQSSFTSLSGLPSSGPEGGSASVIPPRPRKFFKSKNVNIVERVIVEEDIVEDNEETLLTGSNLFTPNHTIIRSSETNLVVAVRVRPMLPREKESVVDINGGSQVVLAAANKIYNFDRIFGSEVCQEDIYRELVNNVVQKVLEGFNATVFAYGQTGTGKTFTMGTGNKESSMEEEEGRGVVIRVLQQILGNSGQDQDILKINISFYEINKEQVYDLLNPSCSKVPLEVREIQKGLFKVVQLTEVEVSTVSGAVELLSKGSNLRSTESTALNSNSSRSHAVFSISLVSADQTGSTITRKLNLVDLAGSESLNRTQAVGDRFTEGVGINNSLSVLSRVITALATKKTVHTPYRDSTLTKVLKESLQPHCMITMVTCISPSLEDMKETVTTLRFANQAKQLRTKPLPAHLLDSCRASVAKKRTHALGIPATSQRANNTIHTVTPSKIAKSGYKRALNSTIGTPGKRARGETCLNTFTTPQMASSSRPITSTTSKDNIHLPDLSGVSVTEPPQDKTSIPTTSSTADLNSILSPLMKAVKENMQQEFDKFKSDFIKSRVETRTPIKTPIKSRATSSPNKMLASTMTSPLDMSEDTIVVTNLPSPKHEDIISGAGITFPLQGRPDPRLRAVINSASPDLSSRPSLPAYDSPPTTQTRHATNSPTIEEMERTLGINPDSPSTLMFTSSGLPSNTNKPKRSSRRKTMMASELNETFALRDIQNMDMATASRRSQRVAAQGKEVLSADTKHPLLETSNWRVVEGHNSRVLGIVNTGNTKLLAGLPGVGPKTALLIHQHRELHGSFNSLRELQMIPGVNKNFWEKFCKQNQISGMDGEN